MNNRIIIALSLTTIALAPSFAHAGDIINFDTGTDCRKNSDSGCSGNRTSCYEAPGNSIILRSSVIPNNSFSGKNGGCVISYDRMREVSVTSDGGKKFTIKEPTKLCIAAHIESGSGPSNLGKGFNAKCHVAFELQTTD